LPSAAGPPSIADSLAGASGSVEETSGFSGAERIRSAEVGRTFDDKRPCLVR